MNGFNSKFLKYIDEESGHMGSFSPNWSSFLFDEFLIGNWNKKSKRKSQMNKKSILKWFSKAETYENIF